MKATSVAVMVIFFESVIPKVLDYSYVQSSFSTITRHLAIEDFMDMDQHKCRACTKTCNLLLLLFSTAIWLPHGQLWAILKETASLT